KEEVDLGDGSRGRVQLVFRDHPEWGRSSYLVLQGGDFDCYGSCRVPVTVDDQAPRRMSAYRPDTDEAIATLSNDDAALWRTAQAAKSLAIESPVKAGGTRTATFEAAGLDPSRMPWDCASERVAELLAELVRELVVGEALVLGAVVLDLERAHEIADAADCRP